jgi:glycosyltransferase involved in cell wall biosynthesis
MKVLIVYPRMDFYGGAELLVVRIANYLTCHHIENALLTTNITPEIAADLTGTELIRLPYEPLTGKVSPLNLLRLVRRLRQGLREHIGCFDVVNVHNYPAEIALWPFRKPVVWMCNEPPQVHVRFDEERKFSPKWFLIKSILSYDRLVVKRRVTKVVVADEFNQQRFFGIYGRSALVNNYGIDCGFFKTRDPIDGLVDPKRFTVLQVGMLTPLKNQLASIKAIEAVRDRIPEIELILAGHGDGEYLKTIQDYVRDKNLADTVRITGHLTRVQIRSLYHQANVLLHPIKAQGGWLSPFEAICAGLPVIVSSEMTSANIISKNNLGQVTSDFASAILDVYQHPNKHKKAVAWRAEWVAANLSWDSFCTKMVDAFTEAMHAHLSRS